MLFSQSLLVFFLAAGSALAGPIASQPASSVPADDGPSNVLTLSSTSSKVQCHTRMATSSVDPVPSSTSTITKTKHTKHSVSKVIPEPITIYKDAVTPVVATRTRWLTETITDSTLTDVFSTTTTVTEEALSTEWATETSTSTVLETATASKAHKRDLDGLEKRAKPKFPVSVTCRETLAVQTTFVKVRTAKPSKITVAASTRSITRTIKSTTTSTIVPDHISSTSTFTDTTTTTNVVTSTTTSVVMTTSTTTIEAPAYSSAPAEQQSSHQPMSSQAEPSMPASVVPMSPNNPPSSIASPPASSNEASDIPPAPSSNVPIKSVAPIPSGQPMSSEAAPAPASSQGAASSDVPQASSVKTPISSQAPPSKGSVIPPPPGSMSSMEPGQSQGPAKSSVPGSSSKAPAHSDVPAGSGMPGQSFSAPVQSQPVSQPAQSSSVIPESSSQSPADSSAPAGQSSVNPVISSRPSEKASSGMAASSSHPAVPSSQVPDMPSRSKAPSVVAPSSAKAPVAASSNAASSVASSVSVKPSSPASSSAHIAGSPPGSLSSSSFAAPSCTPSFRAYPPQPDTYNDIMCSVRVEAPDRMYSQLMPDASTMDACLTACDNDATCCGGNFDSTTNSCSILITTDTCLAESKYTLTRNAHISGFIWVDPSTDPTTTPSLTSTGPTCSPSEVICTTDETTYNQVLCGQELLDASGYSLKPLPITTATTRDACVTACDNNNCCGGNFYSQDNSCVLLTATTGYGCPNVNAYAAQADLEVDSFIWVDHSESQQDPDTTSTGPNCTPSQKPQARGNGYYNQVLCSQEVVGADYGYTFSWKSISTATSNDACMLACDNNGAQACCAGNFFHANSSCVHLVPIGGYCPALAMYEVEATSTADAFIWVWEDAVTTTTTTTSPTSPPTPTCTSGTFDIGGGSQSFNEVYCGQSIAPSPYLSSTTYSQQEVYAPFMATCELKCNVMTNCCAGNFHAATQSCTLILSNNGDNHHCHQSLFQGSVSAGTDSFVYYDEDFYY